MVVGSVVAVYLELVYLATALVLSEMACLANSPGRRSLTVVWISQKVMADILAAYLAVFLAAFLAGGFLAAFWAIGILAAVFLARKS